MNGVRFLVLCGTVLNGDRAVLMSVESGFGGGFSGVNMSVGFVDGG